SQELREEISWSYYSPSGAAECFPAGWAHRPRCPLPLLSSCGSAAELSTIRANLTERLQESNTKLVSAIEERDQLKANLTEMTEELKRLQSLSKQKSKRSQELRSSERRFHGVIILLLGLLSVFLLAGLIGLAVHYRTCPAGWRMLSCTCYFFSTMSASWEESRRDCRDKGADLVVIESYEEQELLSNIIKTATWIGLNDREKEGVWKWIDETRLTQASQELREEISWSYYSPSGAAECFPAGWAHRPRCPLRVTPSWFHRIEERDQLKANLTERLQESNTKLVSAIEERDQLKARLTEMTKKLKRLQSLSKQSE
ncbi:hypothetical protein L3Q82_017306, partial [Scortum barcoo]